MLKKILNSFLKTTKEFGILAVSEVLVFLFFYALNFLSVKIFSINLVNIATSNVFSSVATFAIIFGGAGFIAIHVFNLNKDAKLISHTGTKK